jgi:hypothetical protein
MEDKIRHLLGGPPSMSSSTLVMATVGAPCSTSQGTRHQRLHQLQRWPLLELPTAPPRGPAIDVFINFGGGRWQSYQQHLLGGSRSTSSSTSMVAATGAPDITSQGPRHQRLHQLRWWPLPKLPATPPGGPPSTSCSTTVVATIGTPGSIPQGASHRRLVKLGTYCQYFSGDTYQGHYGKHYY